MKFLYRYAVLLLFLTVFAIAQQSTPTQTPPDQTPPPQAPSNELPDMPTSQVPQAVEPTGPTAVLDTSMGRITCRLYDKQAPITVANFIGLAEGTKAWTDPTTKEKMTGKPFYNGTTFHRVIPEFMIQGGDPTATGTGDPGYMFEDEFDPALNFDVPGRLAMANSGPHTNGSQFFITEVPTTHLNQKHTIFGQCDQASISVVSAIAQVQRDADDKPLQPVTLIKVTIVQEGQPLPPTPAVPAPVAPASAPAAPPSPQ
jgi:peptidyl-prolyl cis-trans isomerase A (cyclophilin A)